MSVSVVSPHYDSEAAFPTAQLVAYMRAVDAKRPAPCIGSNIGCTVLGDQAAAALAGETGRHFSDDFRKGPCGCEKTEWQSAHGLVARTMLFDKLWMAALDDGITQFVILAVGLDARPFRLPRLDDRVTVFEVDVPGALRYREEALARANVQPSARLGRGRINRIHQIRIPSNFCETSSEVCSHSVGLHQIL